MLNVVEKILNPNFGFDLESERTADDGYFGEVIVEEKPRTPSEIQAAEHEFFEKLWYQRHLSLRDRVKMGEEVHPEIWEQAQAAAQRIRDTYGEGDLEIRSDYEWGMLRGKLSALRWVMGSEWDFLDT